jgi:hypothetical protein
VPVVPAVGPSVPDTSTLPTAPQFVAGFAMLKQQLGPIMGSPLEDEQPSPDSCDTHQLTTTGLAYWRCSTNVMSFVAADGQFHWAWTGQIVSWRAGTPDPPLDAAVLSASDLQADVCLTVLGDSGCPLADGMSVIGYIEAAGQTNTYRFEVGDGSMDVVADLTQLPADYDLYLADSAGNVIDASVQEGISPEHVDDLLGPGSYYLFVHADPGRPFDPDNPYSLHLAISQASATVDAAP